MKQIWKKLRKVLYLKDSPERIARGAALGMFVAWTPTIGFQMAISGFLSFLVRGNAVIAVSLAWVSNPYTAVPIYWFNYVVGCWVLGGEPHGWDWFAAFIAPEDPMSFREHMILAYEKIWDIAGPLFLGSVVTGIPLAVIAYVLAYRFVVKRDARELVVPQSSADNTG